MGGGSDGEGWTFALGFLKFIVNMFLYLCSSQEHTIGPLIVGVSLHAFFVFTVLYSCLGFTNAFLFLFSLFCYMMGSRANKDGLVRWVSWNCKGLNNPVKRNKVLIHLRKLKANFVFLQETHLCSSDHFRLKKDWVGQVYHSHFQFKSRGCGILIHKSTPFVISQVIADHKGRYVIVTGTLFSIPLILANVYAPNYDDATFITSFLSCIPDLHSHSLILGGDFNFVMCPRLDRSSKKVMSLSKCATIIQSFLRNYGICDAFRFLNPSTRKFSFFSSSTPVLLTNRLYFFR